MYIHISNYVCIYIYPHIEPLKSSPNASPAVPRCPQMSPETRKNPRCPKPSVSVPPEVLGLGGSSLAVCASVWLHYATSLVFEFIIHDLL